MATRRKAPARKPRRKTSDVRTVGTAAGGLIRKLRKPLAPPTRVGDDGRKYRRAREQNKLRRETESDT
jgi:hypothetical protein